MAAVLYRRGATELLSSEDTPFLIFAACCLALTAVLVHFPCAYGGFTM